MRQSTGRDSLSIDIVSTSSTKDAARIDSILELFVLRRSGMNALGELDGLAHWTHAELVALGAGDDAQPWSSRLHERKIAARTAQSFASSSLRKATVRSGLRGSVSTR